MDALLIATRLAPEGSFCFRPDLVEDSCVLEMGTCLISAGFLMEMTVSFTEFVRSTVTNVPVINSRAMPRPNHFRRE